MTDGRDSPVSVSVFEGNTSDPKTLLPQAALEARKHWLTVEWLPKYAPKLNDIEAVRRDLKAHHLAHKSFTDASALDCGIHTAVAALNAERQP